MEKAFKFSYIALLFYEVQDLCVLWLKGSSLCLYRFQVKRVEENAKIFYTRTCTPITTPVSLRNGGLKRSRKLSGSMEGESA